MSERRWGRMVTFKASPALIDKIDYTAERVGRSVGDLVEMIFAEGRAPSRDEFCRLTRIQRVLGPFSAKISFRVKSETAKRLRALGGRRLGLGQVARFLFAILELPARPAATQPAPRAVASERRQVEA